MSKRNRSTETEDSSKKSKPDSAELNTHILDLNDDCFEAIFHHLLPTDLCALNKTCRRFVSLTEDCFQRKFRDLELSLSTQFEETLSGRKFRLSSDVLVLFGKFIQKLKVDKVTVDFSDESRSQAKDIIEKSIADDAVQSEDIDDAYRRYDKFRYKARKITAEEATRFWDDIHTNCSQLQELTITDSDLEYINPNNIQAEPRELKILQLIHCCGVDKDFEQINGYFTNFECLTVKNSHPWSRQHSLQNAFFRQHLPQLKEISCDHFSDVQWKEFIRRNPQIEKIESGYTECKKMSFIAEHCKNLRSISIVCWHGTYHVRLLIDGLSRFEKLKELYINCDETLFVIPVIEMLAREMSLETLGLCNTNMDLHLCDALSKITNLKSLILMGCVPSNGNSIQKLLTGLTLKNFEITWDESITFEDIETAVKYGRTLESMTIDATAFAGGYLDDDRFLRLVNARKESGASSRLDISVYDDYLQDKLWTDALILNPRQESDSDLDSERDEPIPVHQVSDDVQHNKANARLIKLKSITSTKW